MAMKTLNLQQLDCLDLKVVAGQQNLKTKQLKK